jgi:hypothetical protein
VRLLLCDRMEERENFISLISAAAAEAPFHAVIDFTGFHRDYVRDTIKALHTVSEAEVRKRCPRLYVVLKHIVCQDRLGTNIQKNREQRQRVTETVLFLQVIRNVDHYIFISTDSVYMGARRPFPSLTVGSVRTKRANENIS